MMQIISYKHRGVSLMEVLTAVAILSVLGSTSYVSWRKYIRNAITSEAKASLSMVFAAQAQYKATCNTYYPDLKTIGALPKGKLYYNVGGTHDTGTDWGHCLTTKASNCTSCEAYFDKICCLDQAAFEDFDNTCPCFIRPKYKIDKPLMEGLKSKNYCGASNIGISKNKLCILAATAINRDQTNSNSWDVWAVNHLNIIKQVHHPGD